MRKPSKKIVRKTRKVPLKKSPIKRIKASQLVSVVIWDPPTDNASPVTITAKADRVFQWMVAAIDGQPVPPERWKAGGWRPVHFTDHIKTLTSDWRLPKNQVGRDGLVLYWRSKPLNDVALEDAHAAALKQSSEHLAHQGSSIYVDYIDRAGFSIPTVAALSEGYERVASSADPVDVEVTITFRMTGRWQDAAAALNLSNEEYARRRVALWSQGAIPGLLLPIAPYSDGNTSTCVPLDILEINLCPQLGAP